MPFSRSRARYLLPFLAIAIATPTQALAEETALDLAGELERARDAALTGRCDLVREISTIVRRHDPEFHGSWFWTDSKIVSCLREPRSDAVKHPILVSVPGPAVPPLKASRVVGEILVGGLSSVAGMFGGVFLGIASCDRDLGSSPFEGQNNCILTAVIGGAVGGMLGLATGVYLVGNAGDQTGSFGWTIVGGLVGALPGLLYIDKSSSVAASLSVVGWIIGSVAGFNLSRRWKKPDPARRTARRAPTALVEIDGRRAMFGVPIVLHGNVRGTPTTSVSLIGGAF